MIKNSPLSAAERSLDKLGPAPMTADTDVPREAVAASIETRVNIAPLIAAARTDVRIKPLAPEAVEHRANLLLGDSYLRSGLLSAAHEHYALAGATIPKEQIIECGNVCFEKGRIDDGLDAYSAAGVVLPNGKLEAVGDALFEKGELSGAFHAYFVAGARSKFEDVLAAMRRRLDAER